MLRLELEEHSELPVQLDDDRLDELIAAADGRLTIRRVAGGGHVLSAGSHVGVLVARDIQVAVQPKVPLHNLFLMLGVRTPELGAQLARFGEDEDLLTAMARFFAESVERATVRGTLRGYRGTEEHLVAPRGRIDMATQLRRPSLPSPVACRYDEFTDDIFENRVLVAALDRVRRVPGLPPHLRSRLEHLATRLGTVHLGPVDPRAVDDWRPTRLNRHYEVALRLAAIVLRNVSLRNSAGDIAAPAFMVDMNVLFQDFVFDRLRNALRGRLEVSAEPTVHLGEQRRLAMRPDLIFRPPGSPRSSGAVFVGDAKYKLSSGPARMSDYYQLLAYTTALGLDEGVLVYAQHPTSPSVEAVSDDLIDDPIETERVHTVYVQNTSKQLHVHRLNVAGTNRELDDALKGLADWLSERAAANDGGRRLASGSAAH